MWVKFNLTSIMTSTMQTLMAYILISVFVLAFCLFYFLTRRVPYWSRFETTCFLTFVLARVLCYFICNHALVEKWNFSWSRMWFPSIQETKSNLSLYFIFIRFASVSIWLSSYTSCIIIFVQVHEWISIGTKNAKKARSNTTF